jgi:hypothetical protein
MLRLSLTKIKRGYHDFVIYNLNIVNYWQLSIFQRQVLQINHGSFFLLTSNLLTVMSCKGLTLMNGAWFALGDSSILGWGCDKWQTDVGFIPILKKGELS